VNRLLTETRGIGSWRDRLASPDRQWKRGYSAFETAVSWEIASKTSSGIPGPLETVLRGGGFDASVLLLAIGEHKVDLPAGAAASQSDVWALIRTTKGLLSLSVEAKAREAFGDDALEQWLIAGGTALSISRRQQRWDFIRSHLPEADSFLPLRYQMLHRCAVAVIEARRIGCPHAAFIVQAFNTPDVSFQDYALLCATLKIPAARDLMATTAVGEISLSVGWADCPLATDEWVAACA
jgi:hypothetical protein